MPSIKIMLTSRLDLQVQRDLHPLVSFHLGLDDEVHRDVELYVKEEIVSRLVSQKLKIRDATLQKDIENTIISRAGTFLQAKLQLDVISSMKNDKELPLALQNLSSGLATTYKNILLSTMARYPSQIHAIKTMLEWLIASVGPLTPSQLAEIIAIAPDDESLDFDSVSTDPNDIFEPIAQLVDFHRHSETTYVQLCHFSLKEYICSEEIASGPVKDFHVDIGEAHVKAAGLCLQYLSFSCFDIPSSQGGFFEIGHDLSIYALRKYSARNWSVHLRMSHGFHTNLHQFEQHVKLKLGWFLDPNSRPNIFRNWENATRAAMHLKTFTVPSPLPLYFAVRNGLHEIVDILLPRLSYIDSHFDNGFTCMAAAASGNNVLDAKKLLALGAQVDLPTKDRGLTPLHLAAQNACEDMVHFLLSAGASIHSRSGSKTTPFYRAARGGSLAILQLLYDKGSEVDAKIWDNCTPLMEAVENGHEPAVELLLSWGADPDNHSRYGSTPMSLALDTSQATVQTRLEEAMNSRELSSLTQRRSELSEDWFNDEHDSDLNTVWIEY